MYQEITGALFKQMILHGAAAIMANTAIATAGSVPAMAGRA